jgi:DNA-binding transcriptional regulator YhcF (GntR family)
VVTAELDIQIHLLYHIYNRWILAFLNKKEGDIMLIEIDFSSDEAIYQQLCNQIILGIATSRLTDGDVLPSVRQMADDIGINMHTVNKAYTVLKQEGYVKVDRRKGAVIAVDMDKLKMMEELKKELQVMIARGSCKNITKDEFHALINEIYKEYGGLE